MSTEDAQWLFQNTLMGSPLTIKGTERKLRSGNGWTDWDKPWDEYVKGRAIPYPAATPATSGGAGPSPSVSSLSGA